MTKERDRKIEQLVQQAQKGDREAFSEIVRITMSKIFSLTYKMTGDRDTAKDLAQETFITAWEKIKSFRSEGNFAGWLMRIASNKSLNFLKSAKRNVRLDNIDMNDYSTSADSTYQPDTDIYKEEMKKNIIEFMLQLPAQQRLAFELRFYKELSFNEIASITGSALGTVKTNYREAVKKLREHAIEKGWR